MIVDLVFAFGRAAASSVADKSREVLINFLGISAGPADPLAETSAEEPVYSGLGLVSRPDPPDADGYAEVLVVKHEDNLTPIGFRDLRISRRTNPKPGAVMLAHYGGGFLSLEWDAERRGTQLILYSPRLSSDLKTVEKAHLFSMDSAEANSSIIVLHREGHGLFLTKEKHAILKSANGQHAVGVSDDGVVLSGLINLAGGIVAGNGASAQPVALFPAQAAAMTAIDALLTAIVGVVTTEVPASATVLNPLIAVVNTLVATATNPATAASMTLKASPV